MIFGHFFNSSICKVITILSSSKSRFPSLFALLNIFNMENTTLTSFLYEFNYRRWANLRTKKLTYDEEYVGKSKKAELQHTKGNFFCQHWFLSHSSYDFAWPLLVSCSENFYHLWLMFAKKKLRKKRLGIIIWKCSTNT